MRYINLLLALTLAFVQIRARADGREWLHDGRTDGRTGQGWRLQPRHCRNTAGKAAICTTRSWTVREESQRT